MVDSIFLKINFEFFIRITLRLFPSNLINNKAALVQLMAGHHTGAKLLPEPMLTKMPDTIWCH